MTRLLIHVEGQTEETFVKAVLAPHLYEFGYTNVGARLVGNARARARRGGIRDWVVVRNDIERHLRNDAGAYSTLMVDYYALPNSWPGRDTLGGTPQQKYAALVEGILADFEQSTGIQDRFIPFVLMHEFEALLFSDCHSFAQSIGFAAKADALQNVRDQFADPEHINDSPQTAPSKRVEGVIQGYDKVLFGGVAAHSIGLERICQECPNFGNWVARLEQIPA